MAQGIADHPLVNKNAPVTHLILETIKLPGWFPFSLCIALIVGLLHQRRWLAGLPIVASGIIVGLLYSVLKWMVGRHRPDHGVHPFRLTPFAKGFAGLWREKSLCFPSGHSSLAFATAVTLAVVLPRWRALFFVIALCTAAERVVENAHYLSDVVAGAGLGAVIGTSIARSILGKTGHMSAPSPTNSPARS